MLGLFKLAEGDQLYVTPLDEFSEIPNPGHTHPGLGPAAGSGIGFNVARTTSVFVQENASVRVTV